MSNQWQQQLTEIVQLLERYRALWQESCFGVADVPWQRQFECIYQWLVSLDDDRVALYEQHQPQLLIDAAVHLPDLQALSELTAIALKPQTLLKPFNPRQFAHVPGRKMDQISHFVAALAPSTAPLLEWCGGKGHLGRLFAQQHHCPVVSLEYNGSLCSAGEQLAQRSDVQQRFVCQDALTDEAASALSGVGRAVALHACGDLHLRLIDHCIDNQTAELAISPCCYHLTKDECYRPRSSVGKQQDLRLTKSQLRLAVLQTATAPARVKQLRATEVSFRLGFKLLTTELGCSDHGLGSCRKQLFSDGFAAFCQWAANKLQISLPASVDWHYYQHQGDLAWRRQRRLELARQLFRPAIEHYLVLDRALYLEQHGYRVALSRFCDAELTPRNILIFAQRHSG